MSCERAGVASSEAGSDDQAKKLADPSADGEEDPLGTNRSRPQAAARMLGRIRGATETLFPGVYAESLDKAAAKYRSSGVER